MPANRKATDADIMSAYGDTGSVWLAAKRLGVCGQTVWERLKKLGVNTSMNLWTEADTDILKAEYAFYKNAGKLIELAGKMGRTRHFICRKARELGLTNYRHEKKYLRTWKGMDVERATMIFEHFKSLSLGVGAYCRKMQFDDLGFSKTMKSFFPDEWEHVVESKLPRTSPYCLGRAVEYRVRDKLRSLGYFVMRSPGSRSPVDLVAIKKGMPILFVQAKRNMVLPTGEWNDLFDLAESVGALAILAGSPTGRGLDFKRLIAKKKGGRDRSPQPMTGFDPSAVGELPHTLVTVTPV